jgi:hypothetical protein
MTDVGPCRYLPDTFGLLVGFASAAGDNAGIKNL